MNEDSTQANRFDLPEFWRLLEDLEDGSLDETQLAGLARILEQSPAARRAYFEYFQQSAVLRMEAAQWQERESLAPLAWNMPRHPHLRRSLLAAAAVVAFSAALTALVQWTTTRNSGRNPAQAELDASARLMAEASAETQWSIDGIDQGTDDGMVPVTEGSTVKVVSGTLKLEHESGDLLVMQGPVEVSFPAVHRPQLRQGWLWIDAESSTQSYQIETPSLMVRDIGTRFGVRVKDDGGVETHLVSGRIAVLTLDSEERVAELEKAGSARAFATQGAIEEVPPAVDPFSTLPKLLGQTASYRTTVLGQSPVGCWSLDEAKNLKLVNEIQGSSTGLLGLQVRSGEPGMDGTGGFADLNKAGRSLHLDGSSPQSVIYDIDGMNGVSQREGAVSFWIRCTANTAGRDQILWLAGRGDEGTPMPPDQAILHTVLTASGHVAFEINNGDANLHLSSSRNIADGRWHQVVASWGPKSADLFIDGHPAATASKAELLEEANFRGRHVRFGKPSSDQIERFDSYTGWVDEIALWDRPLTAAEVDIQFRSATNRGQTQPADK